MNHIEITFTFYLKSRILIYIVERRIGGWVWIQTVDRYTVIVIHYTALVYLYVITYSRFYIISLLWRTYQITTINHSLCTQKQNEWQIQRCLSFQRDIIAFSIIAKKLKLN